MTSKKRHQFLSVLFFSMLLTTNCFGQAFDSSTPLGEWRNCMLEATKKYSNLSKVDPAETVVKAADFDCRRWRLALIASGGWSTRPDNLSTEEIKDKIAEFQQYLLTVVIETRAGK